MWEIRETFVALVTTSIPPIAPLLRSWTFFGRTEQLSTAERVEAAKLASKASQGPKRTASKAGLRAQAQVEHNLAMRDRYLSGFDSDDEKETDHGHVNMSRSGSAASTASTADETGSIELNSGMRRDPHARTTSPGRSLTGLPARPRSRDENALPQTTREMV